MPPKLTKTQKFRKSQLALKNKIWSFARFLKLSFPERYHITHRNFLETPEVENAPKTDQTQKFRESYLALKNKIWSFARFLKLSFTSTVRNVMI